MTGFDPAWLDLREPADAEARSQSLIASATTLFKGRAEITVADLGCGTGSLLRALAPSLPDRQRWLMIDGDPAVLAAASPRLRAWADETHSLAEGLRIHRRGKQIDVIYRNVDLAVDPLPVKAGEADLIGASALFDLVSREWLEVFARRLAATGRPLYAALTYDGQMSWSPPSIEDDRARRLFNLHQTRDKGTGAALGPNAAQALSKALEAHGYLVEIANSPWRLAVNDAPLTQATLRGVADALLEIESGSWIDEWRDQPRTAAVIGHLDILATPPRAG